jgi:P27 family predicted phage terminase small subunit
MSRSPLDALAGGEGTPAEPNWTSLYRKAGEAKRAAAHWAEIINEMRERQTLSVANGHAIERLVLFRILYDRAAEVIRARGALQDAPNAGTPMYNLNFSVLKDAEEKIRMLESELGLAPIRRARASRVDRRPAKPRPADRYLRPIEGGKR